MIVWDVQFEIDFVVITVLVIGCRQEGELFVNVGLLLLVPYFGFL